MKPKQFIQQNATFGAGQPEYLPLPAHLDSTGIVTTCWQLSWRERLKVLLTGQVWAQQMTFHKPLQPQKLSVDLVFVEEAE